MIRKGSLVALYQVWKTFPVSSRANGSVGEGNPDMDTPGKERSPSFSRRVKRA
jgi:hypothetical protein